MRIEVPKRAKFLSSICPPSLAENRITSDCSLAELLFIF
jgi:hypothetical protein